MWPAGHLQNCHINEIFIWSFLSWSMFNHLSLKLRSRAQKAAEVGGVSGAWKLVLGSLSSFPANSLHFSHFQWANLITSSWTKIWTVLSHLKLTLIFTCFFPITIVIKSCLTAISLIMKCPFRRRVFFLFSMKHLLIVSDFLCHVWGQCTSMCFNPLSCCLHFVTTLFV